MQEVAEFVPDNSLPIATMKEEEAENERARQKADHLNMILVSKLMDMSKKIEYDKFSKDSVTLICKLLWNVL